MWDFFFPADDGNGIILGLSPQNFHLIDFNVLTVTTIVLARRLIGAVVKEVKSELSCQEICKALSPFCHSKLLHPSLKTSVIFPGQDPSRGFQREEQRTGLSSPDQLLLTLCPSLTQNFCLSYTDCD